MQSYMEYHFKTILHSLRKSFVFRRHSMYFPCLPSSNVIGPLISERGGQNYLLNEWKGT